MLRQHDMGAIDRSEQQSSVRLERHLNATPDEVWKLLTEPSLLAGWLHARVEIEPQAGGALTLNFQNTASTIRGEITRYEAPSLLEYIWTFDEETPSVVRFELEPDQSGAGTHLRLTHRLLSDAQLSMHAAGWHYHLELLAQQIAGEPTEWLWPRFEELLAQYRAAAA